MYEVLWEGCEQKQLKFNIFHQQIVSHPSTEVAVPAALCSSTSALIYWYNLSDPINS